MWGSIFSGVKSFVSTSFSYFAPAVPYVLGLAAVAAVGAGMYYAYKAVVRKTIEAERPKIVKVKEDLATTTKKYNKAISDLEAAEKQVNDGNVALQNAAAKSEKDNQTIKNLEQKRKDLENKLADKDRNKLVTTHQGTQTSTSTSTSTENDPYSCGSSASYTNSSTKAPLVVYLKNNNAIKLPAPSTGVMTPPQSPKAKSESITTRDFFCSASTASSLFNEDYKKDLDKITVEKKML